VLLPHLLRLLPRLRSVILPATTTNPPVLLAMPNAVAGEREKVHRREAPLYCESMRMLLYEHHARLTTVSAPPVP
jgi:hypothetical protein